VFSVHSQGLPLAAPARSARGSLPLGRPGPQGLRGALLAPQSPTFLLPFILGC
jgi:hypothetical protein